MLDARPLRAGAHLRRRSREDRRGPQWSADRRRTREQRVLRRVRYPGDSQPYARTSSSWATKKWRSSPPRAWRSPTSLAGRSPKQTQRVLWDPIMAEKAGYKHFMLKEIFEQPTAATRDDSGPRVAQDSGQGVPARRSTIDGPGAARRSSESRSWRAARRGTQVSSASS